MSTSSHSFTFHQGYIYIYILILNLNFSNEEFSTMTCWMGCSAALSLNSFVLFEHLIGTQHDRDTLPTQKQQKKHNLIEICHSVSHLDLQRKLSSSCKIIQSPPSVAPPSFNPCFILRGMENKALTWNVIISYIFNWTDRQAINALPVLCLMFYIPTRISDF